MKNTSLKAAGVVVVALCAGGHPLLGADPASTTNPAGVAPDKWQFTLFNPTPVDQMRDMDIDRPNKTNSPHVVDAGHLQIEIGLFDYAHDRDRYHGANARSDTLELGQFNFRLGVLNNLELNAIVGSIDFVRNTDFTSNRSTRRNGFGDLFVGGKLNLWGDDGAEGVWKTAMALQPQFKIPTAREGIGNAHAEFFFGAPFAANLPAGFHLGLETTVSWERSSDEMNDVAGWENSACIDRVFFTKFDAYLEYWSHLSTERHQQAQQTLDIGVTYPLNDNVILDTGLNFGLNKSSNTVEWTAGVSVRF